MEIVADKEKYQILDTFLLSNLSENTSFQAYMAWISLIYFIESTFKLVFYIFINFPGNDPQPLTCLVYKTLLKETIV